MRTQCVGSTCTHWLPTNLEEGGKKSSNGTLMRDHILIVAANAAVSIRSADKWVLDFEVRTIGE